ncbi:glyoxal oxidase [Kwoniella mangroviensis CBS 10435]|uniref:Glyoxal oxidase n=1 Tax=Kwoniella mangroviensis CBS 10435 TaxID=1331196 RepID=A0A1B9IX41_9TREE|nr:glyoxal oxidase [Kwoniella mangroviensis CBS 10435]
MIKPSRRPNRSTKKTLLSLLLASSIASTSASSNLQPKERQVRHRELSNRRHVLGERDDAAVPGGFKIVGDSGVSAQMMFLGTEKTVYILDKAENNSMQVTNSDGLTHPAWGTTYDLTSNSATAMSVSSNTFCAAGLPVANGSWVVFGGNQPVTYEGVATKDANGANPYLNTDGGAAIRLLTPCDDGNCAWQEGGDALTMSGKRWYPSVELLGDGSLIVLGGDNNGGYVSTFVQNNPTYEYWPKKSSGGIHMDFLNYTVPVNLFPLTYLLPGGKLFLQAAYKTILYDMDTLTETPLPDMPYAVRVYPASAATAMLPLTPANAYTVSLLFCGGSSAPFNKSSDGGAAFNVTAIPADDTCVRISPEDANPQYVDDDSMPEGRSMGNFIWLPDGTLWMGNGVNMGTAGYGDERYSIGQSYGQAPLYQPAIYNPSAPSGKRWSRDGLGESVQERMYHSSAILLPDSSVLISGSNPNKDVTFEQWSTSYEVEQWYPLWYNEERPVASGFPTSLSYGGDSWDLTYTPKSASSDPSNAKVVVIRTGFSTHAINFGQRYLELETSYTQNTDSGEVTLHVSQMPPNSNIFQPGPAMIFLTVDGVASQGKMIMIGSGQIETQPVSAATVLPESSTTSSETKSGNSTADSSDSSNSTASSSQQNTAAKSAASLSAGLKLSTTIFGGIVALVGLALTVL